MPAPPTYEVLAQGEGETELEVEDGVVPQLEEEVRSPSSSKAMSGWPSSKVRWVMGAVCLLGLMMGFVLALAILSPLYSLISNPLLIAGWWKQLRSLSYAASTDSASSPLPPVVPHFNSDVRGFVAVQYTGTARVFSAVFLSHLVHLICSSPFTVHLYFVVMVVDDFSDHLQFKATLDRYERCINLDGDWVHIGSRVKGWKMQRQSDVDGVSDFTQLIEYITRTGQPLQKNALRQYWAFNQVDRMREDAQTEMGITYSWVIKIRPDAVQITDIWASLYKVTPAWSYILPVQSPVVSREGYLSTLYRSLSLLQFDVQPLPDLSQALEQVNGDRLRMRSYLVGDLVFTPRASSAVVNLPNCDHWYGWSDQFAAGNASVMTVYYRRGYPPYSQGTADYPTDRVPANTEAYLALTLFAYRIEAVYLEDYCHRPFRSNHEPEPAEMHDAHFRPAHQCALTENEYGSQCCKEACGAVNTRLAGLRDAVMNISDYSPGTVAYHTSRVVDLATALTELGVTAARARVAVNDSRGPTEEEWTSALTRFTQSVEASSRALTFNSSEGVRRVARPPIGASGDHTPEATSEWLSNSAGVDVDDPVVDGNRFTAYSHFTSLALELVRFIQRMQTGDHEVGVESSPDWPSRRFGRVAFTRFGTAVGAATEFCAGDGQLAKFRQTDQRYPTVQLSTDALVLSKFKQHEVCDGTNL